MRRLYPPVLILLAALPLASCRSSKPAPALAGESIRPNQCRVLLTVVSIDTLFRSANPKDPCSKAPCRATLRIEEVLGYGSAFGRPLSGGELITATFAFTIAPTQDILPTMTHHYPGVSRGTKLVADIEAQARMKGSESSHPSFLIYGYQIQ